MHIEWHLIYLSMIAYELKIKKWQNAERYCADGHMRLQIQSENH